MSLSESDKSAASCALRDSARVGRQFALSGCSVDRLGAWLTSHLRCSYDPGLKLSGSAYAAVAVVGHTAVRDRLVTVQFYRCHSSVGDCLGTIQCRHRHSVVGRLACHFASESVVVDIC